MEMILKIFTTCYITMYRNGVRDEKYIHLFTLKM